MEGCESLIKTVDHIKVCIIELKRCFLNKESSINDDNFTLHRLQEELEVALQFGLRDESKKTNVKPSYWDYLSCCLHSCAQHHPSINSIKYLEVNSARGRGRAFIRFCLMHKLLADTLQLCFSNEDIAKEFYTECSLPVQTNIWTELISGLRTLNDIDFNLNSSNVDLDVSWPSSSCLNCSSTKKKISETNLVEANSMLEEHVMYLERKCQKLEREICSTAQEENRFYNNSVPRAVYSESNVSGSIQTDVNENLDYKPKSLHGLMSGFPSHTTNHIMSCLPNSNCTVLSNGSMTNVDRMHSTTNVIDSPDLLKYCVKISDVEIAFHEMNSLVESLKSNILIGSDKTVLLSLLTELKNIRDSLESLMLFEVKKARGLSCERFDINEYAQNINLLSLKQEHVLDNLLDKFDLSVKENELLYDSIHLLKEKLHSYGLLKIQIDKSFDTKKSFRIADVSSVCDSIDENIRIKPDFYQHLSDNLIAPFHTFDSTFSKLESLNCSLNQLSFWSESCKKLNDNLTSRIQDHEMHMKGITRELEEAHQLLSVMRKQHQKLQSAENIIKYDLQEKRKLLTKLKHQLESTREDSNAVRVKNTKSEEEWHNLRKDLLLRHKQTSEESGFIEDKNFSESGSPNLSQLNDTLSKNSVEILNDSNDMKTNPNKSRLEILEEQCKLLCTNIAVSTRKREEMNCKLDSWCNAIEKSEEERKKTSQFLCRNEDSDDQNLDDEQCENSLSLDKELNCSLITSEVGSLSSDFESGLPQHNSTSTEGNKDHSFVDFDTDLTDSCSVSANIIEGLFLDESMGLDDVTALEFNEPKSVLLDSECSHSSNNCDMGEIFELKNEDKIQFSYRNKSPVTELDSSNLQSIETDEGKQLLLSKLKDFEILNKLLSDKLNKNALNLADKYRENEALQDQLQSQVMKYENTLKEFDNNNDGLKNMKEKMNEQELLILALEEALSEIQIEREIEKEKQWEQLEDFKIYSLRDKEAMMAEVMTLQNSCKELKKKVVKLLKEKDILWKQNDHLTFIQKIQIHDRWINDTEVSECLGCKNTFSFTRRKHHCRHCGRIFCYSCSDNWLSTPSSRKQIRVCNECYLQYLDMQNLVRRDSNVVCSDEGSEDDTPCNVESLNTDTSSFPKNGSISSLPAFNFGSLKQKSCYASAPELCTESETHPQDSRCGSSFKAVIQRCDGEKCGSISIKPMEETTLVIKCDLVISEIHWFLDPKCEGIPVSLTYEELSQNQSFKKQLLHQSTCEIEGVIMLSLPGTYSFHFDNSMGDSSLEMHYTLKVTDEK